MAVTVSIRPRLAARAIASLLLPALIFASATVGRTAASFSAVSGNPSNVVTTLSVLAPSLNGATSAAAGAVNLAWSASGTAPGSGHTLSYIILRGPTGGPYAQIGTTNGSTLAYTDTPPSDGTYGYVVQTKVSGGGSFTSAGSTTRSAISDRTAPSMTITCDGGACMTAWYTATVSVTVAGTDTGTGLGTLTRSVDGGAPSTTAGATVTFAVSGDSAGHSVGYSGTDAARNTSATAAQTIRIDGTAPSTATGLTSTQGTKGGVATINLSWSAATDALSGLQGYEIRWSNAVTTCPAVGAANYPNSTTVGAVTTAVIPPTGSLTSGSKYCAYLVTIDNAGNRSLASSATGPTSAR